MINRLTTCITLVAFTLWSFAAHAATTVEDLPWTRGPAKVELGPQATLEVPKGYVFLDPAGTRQLDQLMENVSSDTPTYTLAPESLDWTAYFNFDDVGFVKDDDKLDADDLLKSVREGTEESNKERRQNGWETLTLVGWKAQPHYDNAFKSLTWAFLARGDRSQHDIVNYNARLLGRSGVMSVVLVSSPEAMDAAVGEFKETLPGFAFKPGQTYSDFHTGDRVAEYGLAALVAGGAAAVAAKKGFFAVIAGFLAAAWKFVLLGLAALGGFFKRLFTRNKA